MYPTNTGHIYLAAIFRASNDPCPHSSEKRMARTDSDAWLTKLVHDVAQFDGRDPSGLQASSAQDGGIWVRSASAVAYYPLEDWTCQFKAHLDMGFFNGCASPALPESPPVVQEDHDQTQAGCT
ncbi:hypothetical protein ACPWT1_21210 [Ramlibacter sp. MMS24-I3-19]|uniref:hypothetical protein n=1 Tax=Ramlibacter sp. MMS24-I3-19 TaxID=3416606 RepID=UPI003CFBF3EE